MEIDEQERDGQTVEHELEEMCGHLHVAKPGDRVHFCASCSTPIAIYGRLSPCLHVFCLTCATDMCRCFICHTQINRIERIQGSTPLFISSITLQSFKSEEDLKQHTKRVYSHLASSKEFLGTDGQFPQQQQAASQPTQSRSVHRPP